MNLEISSVALSPPPPYFTAADFDLSRHVREGMSIKM